MAFIESLRKYGYYHKYNSTLIEKTNSSTYQLESYNYHHNVSPSVKSSNCPKVMWCNDTKKMYLVE